MQLHKSMQTLALVLCLSTIASAHEGHDNTPKLAQPPTDADVSVAKQIDGKVRVPVHAL